MAHHYQKKWVFTWNSGSPEDIDLPHFREIENLLDEIAAEGVFQMEQGGKTGRTHYQGRFVLKGPRLGKKKLLEIFGKIDGTKNLTFEPERLYDSSSYCTKLPRINGPWYVGLKAYKEQHKPMMLKLRL